MSEEKRRGPPRAADMAEERTKSGGSSHKTIPQRFTCSDHYPSSRYHAGRKSAAYIFSIFGACSSRHQAQLLTSAELLQKTEPKYPIAAMLSPTCWQNESFRHLLDARSITALCVPRIANISCHGPLQRGNFFDEHWTKLNVLNLTGLRVAFYLDSDLVVRRNIDHVIRQMFDSPILAEARTPQGCLPASASTAFFNTGAWAVRPDATDFARLVRWLRAGNSKCYDGDQSAAVGFWRLPHGPGGRQSRQALFLHVGYNMKADQGPERCLRHHKLNESALHVVHFSGREKPFMHRPGKDAIWHSARQQYTEVFDQWARRLGVPSTCTAKRLLATNHGCYKRS